MVAGGFAVSGGPQAHRWLRALSEPKVALSWSLAEWERCIRLARRLRLLARLAESLDAAGLLDQAPLPVHRHLRAEQQLSRWRTASVRWVAQRVRQDLSAEGYPCVLLKGAAYVAQGLDIGRGRLPSDLDLLVPRTHVLDAQQTLTAAGWSEPALDEHDQRYYREWSHEVPPMQHDEYSVELDLHHNILPPVARTTVDAALLLQRLQPSRWPGWKVLHPVDQLLHSAAHLFLDPEPLERLRDLADMDALMRHFGNAGACPDFWAELPRRGAELGLAEPLALAVHFCSRWFETPVPEEVRSAVERQGPSRLRRCWLLPLFDAVLCPTEPDLLAGPWQDIAATIVLMRYHRNRLPLRLLVPHLWHKWRAEKAQRQAAATAAINAP